MSAVVDYAKVVETAKYNEKEYNIQLAELGLSRENLLNEYNNQVLSYQNSILSAESQKDSYKEAMDLTENVYLPQAQANLESYNALLNRWDAAFTAEMTATKQQGQQNYEALLGNFATMGVANAETGREGATANLLEQKQKQNVIDYVGNDMMLDENGGLFGMAATQQALDLEADKASYESQIRILQQSVDMYQWNLNDNHWQATDENGNKLYDENGEAIIEYENPDGYAANMAEIDKTISNYKDKVTEFQANVQTLAKEWGLDTLTKAIEGGKTTTSVEISEENKKKYNYFTYQTSGLPNGSYVSSDGTIFVIEDNKPYVGVKNEDGTIEKGNEYNVLNFIQKLGDGLNPYNGETTTVTEVTEANQAKTKLDNGVYKTSDGRMVIAKDGLLYSATGSDTTKWTIDKRLSQDEMTGLSYSLISASPTPTITADKLSNGTWETSDGRTIVVHNGKIYSTDGSIKSMSESDGNKWITGSELSAKDLQGLTYTFVKSNYQTPTSKTDSTNTNNSKDVNVPDTPQIETTIDEVDQSAIKANLDKISDLGKGVITVNGERYIIDSKGNIYLAEKQSGYYMPSKQLTEEEIGSLDLSKVTFAGNSTKYTTTIGEEYQFTEELDSKTYNANNWASADEGLYEYTTPKGTKKKVYIKNGVMYYVAAGPNSYTALKSSKFSESDAAKVANYGLQKVTTNKTVMGVY